MDVDFGDLITIVKKVREIFRRGRRRGGSRHNQRVYLSRNGDRYTMGIEWHPSTRGMNGGRDISGESLLLVPFHSPPDVMY